jgi:hypothetical protein
MSAQEGWLGKEGFVEKISVLVDRYLAKKKPGPKKMENKYCVSRFPIGAMDTTLH